MSNYISMLEYGEYMATPFFKDKGGIFYCREILIKHYRDVLDNFGESLINRPIYFCNLMMTPQITKEKAEKAITLLKDIITIPEVQFSIEKIKDIAKEICPDKPTDTGIDYSYIVKVSRPINRFDISLALLYSRFGWNISPVNKAYYILRKYGDLIPQLYVKDVEIGKICFRDPYYYTNGPQSFIGAINIKTRVLLNSLLKEHYAEEFNITYDRDHYEYYDAPDLSTF
jgi:hypothetical protein